MSNNPSQNNPTINNTHELNFIDTTNGLNNYSNTFPPMTSQNTSRLNHFYGHNNSFAMNNSIFSTHPPTEIMIIITLNPCLITLQLHNIRNILIKLLFKMPYL